MKKVITIVLVLGVIGAAVGYYMYQKPVDKMKSMSVDEKIEAQAMFEAFELDEAKANQRFLDKVVAVKGIVSKTTKDDDKATIFLETEDMLASIMCQMEDLNTSLPQEGEEVTVKGICTGYLTDVVLVRSIIMKK